MEGPQRHLSAWLAYGLRGEDSDGLAWLDEAVVEVPEHRADELVEACLRQPRPSQPCPELVDEAQGQLVLEVGDLLGDVLLRAGFALGLADLNTVYLLLNVDGLTVVALRGVYAVLAVLELDDVAYAVTDRAIVLDPEVLKGVDEPALHIAALLGADGRVYEPLASTHAVEEELDRREAIAVTVVDEAPRLGRCVVLLEVGEGAVLIAPHDALATDGLLAHAAHHLPDVEARAPGAAPSHDDSGVPHAEALLDGLTRLITCLCELVHHLDLERLLEALAWKPLKPVGIVVLYEVLDVLLHLLHDVVDGVMLLLGDVELVY